MTLNPGEGALLKLTTALPGVVFTGKPRVSPVPVTRNRGYNLVGSQILPPVAGSDFEDVFGFSPLPGDVVFILNDTFAATGSPTGPGMVASTHTYSESGWDSVPKFTTGRSAFVQLVDGLRSGGGVFAAGGTTTITGTTLDSNTSIEFGGGLTSAALTAGSVTIENSTFSANDATVGGGGIYSTNGPSMVVSIHSSTLAFNTSATGGGILNGNGTLHLKNTIVAHGSTGTI